MRKIIFIFIFLCLTGCGFHLRGKMPLAPTLNYLYVQSFDPYDQLSKNLRLFLKMSGVTITKTPEEASAVLVILSEDTSQRLLGINGTQATRQYLLTLNVGFEVTDAQHHILVPAQILTETRTLTINSDQILASSNEATALYQQMRQAMVFDIMNRLSSTEITTMLMHPKKPITP